MVLVGSGWSARRSLATTLGLLLLAISACSATDGDPAGSDDSTAPPEPATRPSAAPSASGEDEGPYEIVESDYRLPRVQVGTMPEPVQMVGHVVAPVDAPGPRPLALFMHGKHASCYIPGDDQHLSTQWPCRGEETAVPNNLGYRYLQRMLARRGFVTVSVAGNGIDSQDDVYSDDNGVSERSAVIRRHLAQWASWADEESSSEWSGEVDMDRVLLVGHSRGGQAVDRVAIDTRPSSPWRVTGEVLLAPTAFGRQAAPRVPTVVLMGYCDGELNWWPGQTFVDRPRDIVADPALRSAVAVTGANHAFFNTEWTPRLAAAPAGDDASTFYGRRHGLCGRGAPTRLGAGEQRAVTSDYVAAAAALFTYGDDSSLRLLDGRLVPPDDVSGAQVQVTALGGRRTMLRPGIDGPLLASGGQASLCVGRAGAPDDRFCGEDVRFERTPHWVDSVESPAVPAAPALELRWDSRGAQAGIDLDRPVDLSSSTHLEARVVVDPAVGPVRLGLRVVDTEGRSATLVPRADGELAPMPGPLRLLGRLWAQTLRAPLTQVDGVDLASVASVALVARSSTGHVWLLDASGWRRGTTPLGDGYVPRVRVADVTAREGSGGSRTVEVPVRVVGTLETTARLTAQVVDFAATELPAPVRVVLQPGQRTATVPITYRADTARGPDREYAVNLWARSGAVTGDYVARVVVQDDD